MDKINIVGALNDLGYGVHASNMINAFNEIGLDVAVKPINNKIDTKHNESLLQECTDKEFSEDAPTLHIWYDKALTEFTGKNLISFSIFETDIVEPLAVQAIEKYSDLVLTTTAEHKKILEHNGITKPIEVVNEGVDPILYNTTDDGKLIETDNYTYLLVGKNEKRKNTTMVINSWIEELQYKDSTLICHTYNPFVDSSWYNANIFMMGYKQMEETDLYYKFGNGYSTIYFTKPVIETKDMKKLYHSANIGIAYSSAEGWGLPEMEMMACGVPVIISNVLGHKEYITDLPVFRDLIIEPIGAEVANDGIFFNGKQGHWYKLDSTEIINKIRYVFENNIGDELSKELSDYIIDNYNWNKIAEHVKQLIIRGNYA